MSYWKWLGKSIKEGISQKAIKRLITDPFTELLSGCASGFASFAFGLALGVSESSLYCLLFLGIIPSVLAISHADYRREMKNKAH